MDKIDTKLVEMALVEGGKRVAIVGPGKVSEEVVKALEDKGLEFIHVDECKGNGLVRDLPSQFMEIMDDVSGRMGDLKYDVGQTMEGFKGSSTKLGRNQKQINKRRKRNKNKKTHRRNK